MNNTGLPLVLEPSLLEQVSVEQEIRIIDLCKTDTYRQYHVPGAVHLDYAQIVRANKPVMGLLPSRTDLEQVFSTLGFSRDTHVVAYDDEGGGKAGRLLWTLAAAGHTRFSLLNGGLLAWANEGHGLTNVKPEIESTNYTISVIDESVIADKAYILSRLGDPDFRMIDARSPEEFIGVKRFAERGGHIPGALNMEWTLGIDRTSNLRMQPEYRLRALLIERGITSEQEVVVYCQTHHRSAFTFILLRSLGYERVRGYPGSWSEWGNSPDTPVDQETRGTSPGGNGR